MTRMPQPWRWTDSMSGHDTEGKRPAPSADTNPDAGAHAGPDQGGGAGELDTHLAVGDGGDGARERLAAEFGDLDGGRHAGAEGGGDARIGREDNREQAQVDADLKQILDLAVHDVAGLAAAADDDAVHRRVQLTGLDPRLRVFELLVLVFE